jgi:hypothetical protein
MAPRDKDAADELPTPAATSTGRRSILIAVAAVLVVIAAIGTVTALRARGDTSAATDDTGRAIPDEALSGAGTPLPHGFVVPDGAELVGPVVVTSVDGAGEPVDWFAVLAVVDDPLAVWSAYVQQIAAAQPALGLDADAAPGCLPYDDPADRDGSSRYPGRDPLCELYAGQGSAAMTSTAGDITGRWLLTVAGNTDSGWDDPSEFGDVTAWPGGDAPAPQSARPEPSVGQPLAPETTAYEGDNEHYVLLDGSELVAQHGAGSITGGFSVLLQVTPGAQVADVAAAYADQANQYEDEPVPPPDVVEHAGTTVSIYWPPGGAGGYSGTVTAVDQPGGHTDYIVYDLFND